MLWDKRIAFPSDASAANIEVGVNAFDFAQHRLDVDDWRAIDGFHWIDSQTLLAYFAHCNLMEAEPDLVYREIASQILQSAVASGLIADRP